MATERMTILANSNVTRGKFAAAAVHTALNYYGIEHGAVVVLGANPGTISKECMDVVHDAGKTEVEPGTVTAGVKSHEGAHWPLSMEEVWDAAFEAGATWMQSNPSPAGIPHDPPRNPFRRE